MNSLQEISDAIMQLDSVEAQKLLDWLQTYLEDDWDKQIKADVKSGRLDKLLDRATADIAADRVKPLDEIINNF